MVINYTSESSADKAQSLATELAKTHSVKTLAARADMGDPAGPEQLIAEVKRHFSHPETGKFQLDILVNNAGVADNHALGEITTEQFSKLYDINVRGPLFVVQAALPYFPNDRSGRIVNVSSVSASGGFEQQSVYGGTKAAVEAMTRTWARELAERCTVNAVNPGPVATDMWGGVTDEFAAAFSPWVKATPLARIRESIDEASLVKGAEKLGGRPAYDYEIAGVIGMLCLPEAGWTTGSTVCANGGMFFTS